MIEPSNEQWIRQAVAEHSGALTGYVAHLLGDLHRARDVVQETFIKLCAQPRERVGDHLRAWLFTTARNRALDVLKKEHRMTTLDPTHEPPAPEAASTPDDRTDGMLSALDGLPPNQREVIRLKFLHDHSYREISAVTGLSESNVGFLIHTGLKTLRRKLAGGADLERSSV